MGRAVRAWLDTDYVLRVFGRRVAEARGNLQRHVVQWFRKGRCRELIGGGWIRSAGGWSAVKQAYREGIRLSSDERLLGSSAFVERTLKGAGEVYDRRMRLRRAGIELSELVGVVCHYLGIDPREMTRPTRKEGSGCARPWVDRLPGDARVVDSRKRDRQAFPPGPFRGQPRRSARQSRCRIDAGCEKNLEAARL